MKTTRGVEQGWFKTDFDSNNWATINVPGKWESQGYMFSNPNLPSRSDEDGYNGYAWYRRSVMVPATWTNQPVRIYFGAIDDSNWVYVNGSAGRRTARG